MKVPGIAQSILRHWPVGALALVAVLIFVLAGQGSTTSLSAQTAGTPALVTTTIHDADHNSLACYATQCRGQIGPEKSVVHDKATVTSHGPLLAPTGTVRFARFNNLHCMGGAVAAEVKPVIAFPGVGTAESSPLGPLPVGQYSYRTLYLADATAKALGILDGKGPCEQLEIIRVDHQTVVHYPNHTPLPFGGQGQFHVLASALDTVVIHDKSTVTGVVPPDPARTPTGHIRFVFYAGSNDCQGGFQVHEENVPVSVVSPGVTQAESITTQTVGPGLYSYKAFYHPDAAAIALGLSAVAPAPCEQINILVR